MKIQYRSDYLIVFESELFRTTTTLILGKDYILLVDPNWLPGDIEYIYQFFESINGVKEKYLLFTHSDYDHIIGYGKFKNYQTISSKNFTLNREKQSILEQINDFDDQYYIKRNYAIEYPEINLTIKNNHEQKQLGSDEYIFYQAVGHNKDGLITYNKSKKILVVGDYLSNIEFPYVYESFMEYENTLNKLQKIIENYEVKILITGHGDFTGNKNEMLTRIELSRTYIQDLKNSVIKKKAFDLDLLFSTYYFPKIMKKFHDGNVDLLKKEIIKRKQSSVK